MGDVSLYPYHKNVEHVWKLKASENSDDIYSITLHNKNLHNHSKEFQNWSSVHESLFMFE